MNLSGGIWKANLNLDKKHDWNLTQWICRATCVMRGTSRGKNCSDRGWILDRPANSVIFFKKSPQTGTHAWFRQAAAAEFSHAPFDLWTFWYLRGKHQRTTESSLLVLTWRVSRVMRLSPQSLPMTGRHYYCDLLSREYNLFVDLGSGSKGIILRQF